MPQPFAHRLCAAGIRVALHVRSPLLLTLLQALQQH